MGDAKRASEQQTEQRQQDTYFAKRTGPGLFLVQYNEAWVSSHRSLEEAERFAKLLNGE